MTRRSRSPIRRMHSSRTVQGTGALVTQSPHPTKTERSPLSGTSSVRGTSSGRCRSTKADRRRRRPPLLRTPVGMYPVLNTPPVTPQQAACHNYRYGPEGPQQPSGWEPVWSQNQRVCNAPSVACYNTVPARPQVWEMGAAPPCFNNAVRENDLPVNSGKCIFNFLVYVAILFWDQMSFKLTLYGFLLFFFQVFLLVHTFTNK